MTQGSGRTKSEKDKGEKRMKFNAKSIAAVIDKKINAKLKAAEDNHSHEAGAEAFISSCLQKFAEGELAVATSKWPSLAATTSSANATNTSILNTNMPVVGQHTYIISNTGEITEVSPFTPDYSSMQIRVINAAVQYDCVYTGKSYILVIRNALHVPSMKHSLLPPFILREAGSMVNETPKIHVDEPTIDDHSITFPETGFRIPMSLWGIFSYFPMSKLTAATIQESEEVCLLIPPSFTLTMMHMLQTRTI